MTFENGILTDLILYPLRLDRGTGLPALADEGEAKIIFDYLTDRCKQFGTNITMKDQIIRVNLND